MTVETFPQKHVTETKKPTVRDLFNQGVDRGDSTEVITATICAAYPGITVGELVAVLLSEAEAIQERNSRRVAEADWRNHVMEICEPFKDDHKTIGDMLKAALAAGDKRAAPILERMHSPENDKIEADLKAAAALDPYWEETTEGEYLIHAGAIHDTAEKLVAAYRANQSSLAESDSEVSE